MKVWVKEPLSQAEALEKLKTYCAYQERSKRQVVQKMRLLGTDKDWDEALIEALISANYLNQERFAEAYSKGKSRIRGWGKQKIVQRLAFELGQDYDSEMHLEGVDEEAAQKKLVRDLGKKREILLKKQDKDLKTKLLNFCISRGFLFEESLKILQTEFGL